MGKAAVGIPLFDFDEIDADKDLSFIFKDDFWLDDEDEMVSCSEELDETYLNREDKILSLARERIKRLRYLGIDDIFTLCGDNRSYYGLLSAVEKKIIKPLLKSLTEENFEQKKKDVLAYIPKEYKPELSIIHDSYVNGLLTWRTNKSARNSDNLHLCLTVTLFDGRRVNIYGLSRSKPKSVNKVCCYTGGEWIAFYDLAMEIARFCVFDKIANSVKKLEDDEFLKGQVLSLISRHFEDKDKTIYLYEGMDKLRDIEMLLLELGCRNVEVMPTMQACIDANPKDFINLQYLEKTALYFFMKREGCVPLDYTSSRYKDIPQQDFSVEYESRLVFDECVDYFVGQAVRMKDIKEYRDNSDRATSFVTKKNIPEKTVRAMKESGFNKFFGYVEFDELVELNKIIEVEKEFESVYKTLFSDSRVSLEDHSVRFRRLGNHKAAGLYYPFWCCLCVDIRNPYSMMHELGHLLDYKYGAKGKLLSEDSAFGRVYRLYKSELTKDGELCAKLGKGKYNLNYYLKNTEVFARCFEMYLIRHRGMDNSIISKEHVGGFAYPCNDVLDREIGSYFDNLLSSLGKEDATVSSDVDEKAASF